MLINEQDVVLEAGVEMWFETQMDNDRVVMAVDVGIDAIKPLKNLPYGLTKMLGKGDTCTAISVSLVFPYGRTGKE